MRVIILCLSPSQGGLELYALEEIMQLTEQGHKCLAVVTENGYLDTVLTKKGIAHATLAIRFKSLPLLAALQLKRIAEEFQADILHFHWGNDLNLAAICKSMMVGKIQLIHSRHMNYTRSKKDIFHRWFYNKIDLLLVGTKVLQEQALKFLPIPARSVKLLYLGTSKVATNKDQCGSLFNADAFTNRALNIAVFGRIEEGKGQHIIIDAVKKSLKEDKDISLTMIGHTMDVSYQLALENNIESNSLSGFIRFLDFLDNATSYMSCFDVVVLSTHCETFGLVLIEAMRAGVVVVGTNAGGVPEIIEDGISGYLVEPRNVNDMQGAINKLYSSPDIRKKMAAAGKMRADTIFSNDVHYPKLEAFLELALKNR